MKTIPQPGDIITSEFTPRRYSMRSPDGKQVVTFREQPFDTGTISVQRTVNGTRYGAEQREAGRVNALYRELKAKGWVTV